MAMPQPLRTHSEPSVQPTSTASAPRRAPAAIVQLPTKAVPRRKSPWSYAALALAGLGISAIYASMAPNALALLEPTVALGGLLLLAAGAFFGKPAIAATHLAAGSVLVLLTVTAIGGSALAVAALLPAMGHWWYQGSEQERNVVVIFAGAVLGLLLAIAIAA